MSPLLMAELYLLKQYTMNVGMWVAYALLLFSDLLLWRLDIPAHSQKNAIMQSQTNIM